ncbi:MAG: glycosyltransferase N-terminal domain-containing protein [Bacteroidia bacterium]|nr:glycosyltransferase N-terminal domain-containing protein [Bacteroidia bacterium]
MRVFYSLIVKTYSGLIHVAAAFGNKKAKLWRDGRKNQWDTLKQDNPDDQWVWMHVSSLGEFEQGLPVIERLKENYPQYKILLTFFSPSGYEVKKNFPLADKIAYMPTDTIDNARRLVANFNLKAAFFVKYEFWFNYIKVLKDNNIPLFYISVILRPSQYFFKPWGRWFRNRLREVKYYFAQNEETANLLNSIGIENVTVTGDTRFDRVYSIAQKAQRYPDVEKFIGSRKCIIAGSSWPSDERLLCPFIEKMPDDYCFIMVPHDISDSHVRQIESQLKDYQLYTKLNPGVKSKVLVINTIGMLSKIYRYARFAYIGAGFYDGIHNIQEAIVFGVPVVFGPKYHDFEEAVDLVRLKGAFVINNQNELDNVFDRFIADESFYKDASKVCNDYVAKKIGATDMIMNVLEEIREKK